MSNLTALITSKNRDVNAQFCIESISGGSFIPKVVLVDFGSKRPLLYLEDKYDFLKVIRVKNNTDFFHKARAINIGIKNINTKFMCITDVDQIFSKNFFLTVKQELEMHSKTFFMCKTHFLRSLPKWLTIENLNENFNRVLVLAKNSGIKFHGDGCCNGVQTAWAKEVHGYDENYIGYGGEDSDFVLRARLSGFRTAWLHNKVNMVHLPHPKEGKYYKKEVFLKNKARYKTKAESSSLDTTVNKNRTWGVK